MLKTKLIISTAFLVFSTLISIAVASNKNIESKKSDSNPIKFIINDSNAINLFNEIQVLLKGGDPKNHVITTYEYVNKKFKERDIRFLTCDDPKRKDIGNCAQFLPPSIPDSSQKFPSIVLDTYLYSLKKEYPSLVYAIIVHEMRHAFDYYSDADRFMAGCEGNELEAYMYEMDALYLEALFLIGFIDSTKYSLSNFERFIISSLKNDGLQSASIAFKGIDNALARQLYNLCLNNQSAKSSIETFYTIGDSIGGAFKYPEDKDSWAKYCSYAPLNTYCKFGPQILRNILHLKDPKYSFEDNFKLEDFPIAYKKIYQLAEKIKPYALDIDAIEKELNDNFLKL